MTQFKRMVFNMKSNLLYWTAFVVAAASSTAVLASEEGGHVVGNGGGGWVCFNRDESIRWIEVVDLFEARMESAAYFGQKLELAEFDLKTGEEIVASVLKSRVQPVSATLNDLWNLELNEVKHSEISVDTELSTIPDSYYRVTPKAETCKLGVIKYVQLANYTPYGKLLIPERIKKDPAMTPTQWGALYLHEAVYRYCRERYGDTDSIRTRRLVGLFFSKLDFPTLARLVSRELNSVLVLESSSFIPIPAGWFMMGSEVSDPDRAQDERVYRAVILTKDFEMQKTNVTQAQYYELMRTNPSRFKEPLHCPMTFIEKTLLDGSRVPLCPNFPVENVTYSEATEFARRKSVNSKYEYRLPTEAQWEYATRAGTNGRFFWGDSYPKPEQFVWFSETSAMQTHEVATLRPNPWGLYDMIGNVAQWTSDWLGSYDVADPRDPVVKKESCCKIVRGGSYAESFARMRSASGRAVAPEIRSSEIGFRLVRTKN